VFDGNRLIVIEAAEQNEGEGLDEELAEGWYQIVYTK